MEKGGLQSSWEIFLHELHKWFGATIYDDPLGRIAKLTQTGKVSQFRAEFEALMTQIMGVPEPMFLNFFVWGSKLEIQREILLAQPRDLVDAMAKAQLFEDRHEDLVGRQKGEGHRTFGSQGKAGPLSQLGEYKPSGYGTNVAVSPTITKGIQAGMPKFPVKRLSPAEL